jgi:hypothetical protein
VVPVVALAYLLHGVFLLTSIGIGIDRRARYYPLITAVAAAVNIGANFAWIPRHGMMGAAWATVASYAVMAALGAAARCGRESPSRRWCWPRSRPPRTRSCAGRGGTPRGPDPPRPEDPATFPTSPAGTPRRPRARRWPCRRAR